MQQKKNLTGASNVAIKFSDHLELLVVGKKYENRRLSTPLISPNYVISLTQALTIS